ncbi:PIR protein [Plasmodium ovale]|uniref:PIR protein n=1 Tax=Plasmodium ovale TaxID=36330 RepID=A0A1C3KG83_PLAOA|nr:PIR protein [Plasmodium ovale]
MPYQKQYEFLNYLEEYEKYENLAEQNGNNNIYNVNYSFVESEYHEYTSQITKMCIKFVYLIEKLLDRSIRPTSNDDYDMDYLNYWLNKEINRIDSNNICKKIFFQNLRSKNNKNANFRKLSSKIYDIKEDELKDMNTLYTLYKKYNEINKTINNGNSNKKVIIEYANECVNKYTEVKGKCSGHSTHFCKALNDFKEKYEKINLCNYNIADWGKKSLPSLEGDQDALLEVCETTTNRLDDRSEQRFNQIPEKAKEDSDGGLKSITIGVVATLGISFIFLILYKFTSIEQLLRSRMNKNESVWQNIDEEMHEFTHTSEHEHIKAGNTSYNIAYDSV